MKTPDRKKKLILTGFSVFLFLMLGFAIFGYFNFHTAQVNGDSMEPTLKNGRRLLMTKAYWLVGPIRHNDIIVATDPTDPSLTIIKRVKGLPGDVIDPLVAPKSHSLQEGEFVVPKGTLYVLGDNAPVSQDSREFGPIPDESVLGKIVILGGF